MTTKFLAIAILAGSLLIGIVVGTVVVRARSVSPDPVAQAESRAVAPPSPSVESSAEHAQKLEDMFQKERTELVAATPARREQVIRWCAASLPDRCTQRRLTVIMSSGADAKEQEHLQMVSVASLTETLAKKFTDGEDVHADGVTSIAVALHTTGKKTLDLFQTTTLASAAKDPDGSRGKVARVGGNVVEIHKHGDLFEGSIVTDDMKIAYFVTAFDTDGIFAGTWAAFRGVFAQEYDYPNVSGGQTRSQLLIGTFVR